MHRSPVVDERARTRNIERHDLCANGNSLDQGRLKALRQGRWIHENCPREDVAETLAFKPTVYTHPLTEFPTLDANAEGDLIRTPTNDVDLEGQAVGSRPEQVHCIEKRVPPFALHETADENETTGALGGASGNPWRELDGRRKAQCTHARQLSHEVDNAVRHAQNRVRVPQHPPTESVVHKPTGERNRECNAAHVPGTVFGVNVARGDSSG